MSPVHLLEIFKTFCLRFCTAEGTGAVHLFSVSNQSQWCHLPCEWIMMRMPNLWLLPDSFSTMSCVKPELSKRVFCFIMTETQHASVSLIRLKLKLGKSVRTVVISAGNQEQSFAWICQYCTCKLWDVRTTSLFIQVSTMCSHWNVLPGGFSSVCIAVMPLGTETLEEETCLMNDQHFFVAFRSSLKAFGL